MPWKPYRAAQASLGAIRQVQKPVIATKPMAGGPYLGYKAFEFVFKEAPRCRPDVRYGHTITSRGDYASGNSRIKSHINHLRS